MKNYTIKIVDKKTNKLIEEKTELSNTKAFLKKKYESKYRFSYPGSKIIVERLIREPGKQMDIFDIIKD
jgi:hypothetical protein